MPEAVIVSTARSPIGRAFKGSLKDIRADDLTVQMVLAALGKIPELDVADIDDLVLGCGQPGGESGFNMGRVVAALAGLDHVPGTTINRYCSSSLQSTRMAMHAIRAGEGLIVPPWRDMALLSGHVGGDKGRCSPAILDRFAHDRQPSAVVSPPVSGCASIDNGATEGADTRAQAATAKAAASSVPSKPR